MNESVATHLLTNVPWSTREIFSNCEGNNRG